MKDQPIKAVSTEKIATMYWLLSMLKGGLVPPVQSVVIEETTNVAIFFTIH